MAALTRWVSLLAPAVLALVVATSPAHAVGQTPDPKQMVIPLVDLPAGVTVEKAGYADNARGAAEPANDTPADFVRWGRINGFEAEFGREALIGHEARMYTPPSPTRVSRPSSTPSWRYRTVKAALYAIGLRGMVDPAPVVGLARKQQTRIATALA